MVVVVWWWWWWCVRGDRVERGDRGGGRCGVGIA